MSLLVKPTTRTMDSTEFNIFFLLNLYSTQKKPRLVRLYFFFKKKTNDTLSASTNFGYHYGGCKIEQLVFWPKNPIFKLFQPRKPHKHPYNIHKPFHQLQLPKKSSKT
jgi:hypothetical protein